MFAFGIQNYLCMSHIEVDKIKNAILVDESSQRTNFTNAPTIGRNDSILMHPASNNCVYFYFNRRNYLREF